MIERSLFCKTFGRSAIALMLVCDRSLSSFNKSAIAISYSYWLVVGVRSHLPINACSGSAIALMSVCDRFLSNFNKRL
ncbi:MAG: hypothetical protein IGS23_19500 [Rivularia sp. T60_A2020_040]|nr:hypothetical protein [Rivularia sp. T60_A2020_040]